MAIPRTPQNPPVSSLTRSLLSAQWRVGIEQTAEDAAEWKHPLNECTTLVNVNVNDREGKNTGISEPEDSRASKKARGNHNNKSASRRVLIKSLAGRATEDDIRNLFRDYIRCVPSGL